MTKQNSINELQDLFKDLVYFTTRVSDTSDTSATRTTRVRHEYDTNDTSATRVRHEQHECDTSATQTTRVRHECYTNDTSATRVRNFDFDKEKNYLFSRAAEFWPTFDIQISISLTIFWKSCKTTLFKKPTEVSQNTPKFISIEPPVTK